MRFLAVQPVGDSLASLYSAEYFETDFRCGRADAHSFDGTAWVEENRGLVDAFERLRAPGRLLEVGSAAGGLLRHAQDRGWTVHGVELSGAAVERARALGVAVTQGTLDTAALPDAAYDLVYMGDVLEHVPDCRATLAQVTRVLAPGGHFYLRGPITTNSLARRLALAACGATGRTIVLREPPYHLWEFTPGPLRRLARACGLEVVRLEQAKIPPGHAHGTKSPAQRAAMAVLDAVNVPITRAFHVLGDRCVLVARKPPR
jgi:SAM-dependent methyltransferase